MSIVRIGLAAPWTLEIHLLIHFQRHTGGIFRFEGLVTGWNGTSASLMIINAWPAEELFTAFVINALEGDILTVVAEYHGVGDLQDRRG